MYAETLQSDNNEVDVDDSSEPNQSNPNASTSSSTANVQNEDDQANTGNASQPQETQQIQAISASDSGSSAPSTPSTWRSQSGQQSQSRPQQVYNLIRISLTLLADSVCQTVKQTNIQMFVHTNQTSTPLTPTQQVSQAQAAAQNTPQQQQQQPIMINYEESGDDSIVPSTPTLYVPRRADGFSEAVSSPQPHVSIPA